MLSKREAMKNKNLREPGTISSVRKEHFRDPNGKPNTAWVYLEFKGGSAQGFGGLFLPDDQTMNAFTDQLLDTFGVKNFEDLVGKECYALRNRDGWSEPIEGLESVDTGKRFTVYRFRKSLGGEVKKPSDEAVERAQARIARLRADLQEAEAELPNIGKDYFDWDQDE